MKIVLATAEPFGGYHLEPMDRLISEDSLNSYSYLIPYNSPIQGNGLRGVKVTSDFRELYDASRLIITGGAYSAWTQSVAQNAETYGIPILHTELAYISDIKSTTFLRPTPNKIGVMSDASAELAMSFFKVSRDMVSVVGSPQLDIAFSARRERQKLYPSAQSKVLIVSSVGLPEISVRHLVAAAKLLAEAGCFISVRTHPREDTSPWVDAGLTLSDRSRSVKSILEETDFAIASTGSFNPMLYTAGIPTVSILQSNHVSAPSAYLSLTAVSEDGKDISSPQLWLEAVSKIGTEQQTAEYLFGTLGGSALRVLDFWRS